MRRRSENSKDNRVSSRLTDKNLESFTIWSKDFQTQSAYMNMILNDYYKRHGRPTKEKWIGV